MRFVRTFDQTLVNLDFVREIREHTNKKCHMLFDAEGGHLGNISSYDLEYIEADSIPAMPGWFALQWLEDNPPDCPANEKYCLTPILAWGVVAGYAVPIGIEHIKIVGFDNFILCPTGQVFDPESNTWPTIDVWIAHQETKQLQAKVGG